MAGGVYEVGASEVGKSGLGKIGMEFSISENNLLASHCNQTADIHYCGKSHYDPSILVCQSNFAT